MRMRLFVFSWNRPECLSIWKEAGTFNCLKRRCIYLYTGKQGSIEHSKILPKYFFSFQIDSLIHISFGTTLMWTTFRTFAQNFISSQFNYQINHKACCKHLAIFNEEERHLLLIVIKQINAVSHSCKSHLCPWEGWGPLKNAETAEVGK